MHSMYLFSLKRLCGGELSKFGRRYVIRDPGYLRDGYHWGVASLISRVIAAIDLVENAVLRMCHMVCHTVENAH